MKNIALSGLETAINIYLHLDPETIKRTAKLSNKVIKIELTDWETSFYVLPSSSGLALLADYDKKPQATISGPLSGLVRVSLDKASSQSLFKQGVKITGDVQLGEQMQDILRRIDIDWEEHLSRFVGDIFAHQIARGFKKTIQIGKHTTETLQRNMKEYLHEEAKYFPTQQQIEAFYRNIGKLRDDVDRAEARIKRLQKKHYHKRAQQKD